jgi:hypothetical protein
MITNSQLPSLVQYLLSLAQNLLLMAMTQSPKLLMLLLNNLLYIDLPQRSRHVKNVLLSAR